MEILTAYSDCRPGAAAIGFFDGVHRGHRYLIDQVREQAARRGMQSVVVTFPVHPRRVVHPDCPLCLLTTPAEKVELLGATGLDACVMLDFTPRLAALSAREFMTLLRDRYRIRLLVVGYDHRFGHHRSEGFDDYVRHGHELSMEVLPARAFCLPDVEWPTVAGTAVSSSLIRRLLAEGGDVAMASRLLGYDYFLQGTVMRGHRVGHTLGFPTANLRPDSADKLIPADGVYAVHVDVDGRRYGGMLCIGRRPTLDNGPERTIEANIFDFDADIYGRRMRLSFVSRTRGEQRFASLDELAAQLRRDEVRVRHILRMD